ncbi:MAG: nitroreductase family protein [Rhodoglobus sp.]
MAGRRSHAVVTAEAPTHEELLPFVSAVTSVADHGALRPWRLIELRGDSRELLGAAFVETSGLFGEDAARLAAKPLRASLLIAIVAIHQPSFKVAEWEQDAAAAGVGHLLSLVLNGAGWGVMWRTGGHTRADAVRRVHGLADNEKLLGWLYVGRPEKERPEKKAPFDPESVLSSL